MQSERDPLKLSLEVISKRRFHTNPEVDHQASVCIDIKCYLENAHVAVCTNPLTAEDMGRFYQQRVKAIQVWTPKIMGYRNEATEY